MDALRDFFALRKWLRRFFGLTWAGRFALLCAAWWLSTALVALRFAPYRVWIRWIVRCARQRKRAVGDPGDIAAMTTWAVDLVARKMGVTCLPRAIATHVILRRRGLASSLYLGVRRSGPGDSLEQARVGAFEFHAWVTWADAIVMGRIDGLDAYAPLWSDIAT